MPLSKWAIRLSLRTEELPAKGAIGYDCNGSLIEAGDELEVIEEEMFREGKEEYKFCSNGKRCIAVAKPGQNFDCFNFVIRVKFPGKKHISMFDYFLKKVEN